jgi:hypothetical protein
MSNTISLAIVAGGVLLPTFGTSAYNVSASDIVSHMLKEKGIARKTGRKTFAHDR